MINAIKIVGGFACIGAGIVVLFLLIAGFRYLCLYEYSDTNQELLERDLNRSLLLLDGVETEDGITPQAAKREYRRHRDAVRAERDSTELPFVSATRPAEGKVRK